MNLLVLSDLHLEFSTLDIDTTGVDVIVLAGDIHLGKRGLPWIEVQSRGLPVIYVPGNHEFYKGEHSRVARDLRAAYRCSNCRVCACQKRAAGHESAEFVCRHGVLQLSCPQSTPSAPSGPCGSLYRVTCSVCIATLGLAGD
ncbi:metallophosphoesterase [Ralstonia pseudosolanacearum]|uniref:metallophosphoesterase n=1 Tax=Ralstonia pseudosolanacearum TaxID=1310165 RepID=UPI001E60A6BB|nr:metallophosphoesterase [Ralstonia pseudosolanacearum]